MTARTLSTDESTIKALTNNFMARFYLPEKDAPYIERYLQQAYDLGQADLKKHTGEGMVVIGYDP